MSACNSRPLSSAVSVSFEFDVITVLQHDIVYCHV